MRLTAIRGMKLYTLPTLPHYLAGRGPHANSRVKIELLKQDRHKDLTALFDVFAKSGGGVGVGVDGGLVEKLLVEPTGEGRTAIQVTVEDTGTLVGASLIYSSWMCRSNKPTSAAGYFILHPDYVGYKIGAYYFSSLSLMTWDLGYLCHQSRTSVVSLGYQSTASKGYFQTGIIPQSVLVKGKGRLDDILRFSDYRCIDPEEYDRRIEAINLERDVLPAIPDESRAVPDWVVDEIQLSPQVLTLKDSTDIRIMPATGAADIWQVEALIRQAATDGRGFALDEFKDGYFNRRLLRRSHVITATTLDGTVIGGAIFGPTQLCRSATPPYVSTYIAVHPDHRRRGIGQHLLKSVEDYVKSDPECMGLFMDTFITDHVGIQFLRKLGFTSVASFPKCGFVKGHGLTESLLWYRHFYERTIDSLHSSL